MIKQYFKQALHQIKDNKLLSFISVFGTALAIAMIMVMVIVQRVATEPHAPEVNRDRMLYVKWASLKHEGGGSSNGPLGYKLTQQVFKTLNTPEAVATMCMPTNTLASVPGGEFINVRGKGVDAEFFKVFAFDFIDGKPFEPAENASAIRKAVITETVARKLFGETNVAGKEVLLNMQPYTVCGVVRDVSKLSIDAFSQVWIPLTTFPAATNSDDDTGSMGPLAILILARSKSDFAAIREEVQRKTEEFNKPIRESEKAYVDYRNQPDDIYTHIHREWANITPDMANIHLTFFIAICLLLIVPAINLSGLTISRMRKRYSELGVRRSFGATRSELLVQILTENLLLTLIGGLLGLVLSFAALYIWNDTLLADATMPLFNPGNADVYLSVFQLIDPMIFFLTLLFCLLLNLLSAGIPAWRASRQNIVNALNS